ncbi:hypothetical protein [Myroides odoratus]|uniref:hypothetical protein n=1 Tax=Myroides odoratus TaxID=256 RepID=UPI000765832D|nr:hypothetical protein [Myroides odoratus]
MLKINIERLKSLDDTNYFKDFLLLLEKEKEQGRDYVIMKTIPKILHYQLIQENFVIKRKEIKVRKFLFIQKNVLVYIIKLPY